MAHKVILVVNGQHEERDLEGRSVKLGRDPGNDIIVDPGDRSVSRFHARLDHDGRHWHVVDANSTNHVRVNGELIEPAQTGACVLSDGDTVLLGSFELRFVREEHEHVVFEDDKLDSRRATQAQTVVMRPEDLARLIGAAPTVRLPRQAEEAIERAKGIKRGFQAFELVGVRNA
jgi:pSer/pThr/pTyr-binding forkhead associated (FHA) protein